MAKRKDYNRGGEFRPLGPEVDRMTTTTKERHDKIKNAYQDVRVGSIRNIVGLDKLFRNDTVLSLNRFKRDIRLTKHNLNKKFLLCDVLKLEGWSFSLAPMTFDLLNMDITVHNLLLEHNMYRSQGGFSLSNTITVNGSLRAIGLEIKINPPKEDYNHFSNVIDSKFYGLHISGPLKITKTDAGVVSFNNCVLDGIKIETHIKGRVDQPATIDIESSTIINSMIMDTLNIVDCKIQSSKLSVANLSKSIVENSDLVSYKDISNVIHKDNFRDSFIEGSTLYNSEITGCIGSKGSVFDKCEVDITGNIKGSLFKDGRVKIHPIIEDSERVSETIFANADSVNNNHIYVGSHHAEIPWRIFSEVDKKVVARLFYNLVDNFQNNPEKYSIVKETYKFLGYYGDHSIHYVDFLKVMDSCYAE